MDVEFVKWLATLGIGGILAGFIFIFYRKDIKSYTELWKTTSEQLIKVVGENTASNVKLCETLSTMKENMVTIEDLHQFYGFGPKKEV
jgi:hypothetical protein